MPIKCLVSSLWSGLLGLVCGLSCLSQAGAQNRPVTINDLVQPPIVKAVSLAPDGRHVAYLERTNDFHALARALDSVRREDADNLLHHLRLVDLASPDDAEPVRLDLGSDIPMGIDWVGPNRIVVSAIAVSEDNGHPPPERRTREPYYQFYWRLVAVDIRTGDREILFGDEEAWDMRDAENFTSVIHPLPDQPDEVLVAAHRHSNFDLWRLNLATGEEDRVERARSNTVDWAANEEGRAYFRLDVDVEDDEVRIYRRGSDDSRWSRDERLTLNEFVDYIERAERSIWVANTDSESEVLVSVRPPEADRRGVYRYDLDTGEVGDLVWEHPQYDLVSVLRDGFSDRMVAVTYFDDRRRAHFFDRRLNAHFQALTAYFEEDAVVLPVDANDEAFLLYVTGPQEPGSYYAYSINETRVRPLMPVNPALLGTRLSPVSAERLVMRDGLEIDVFVTHPAGYPRQSRRPTVVMPHGGPEARDSFGFDFVAQYFASEGWRVIQPNFRGSEGYGREFAARAHGEWSRAVQDDITDTLTWSVAQGLVDPERVCIAGFSYGGYAALAGAFVTPDAYQCVVSVAGLSDPVAYIDWSRENRPDSVDYWTRQIGDPEIDPDGVRAMSPIHQIDRMQAPILLLHGDTDSIVPAEQSFLMADALEAAGYDYRSRTIRGAGHDLETPISLARTLALMEAFMGEYLDVEQPADRQSWQELTEVTRFAVPGLGDEPGDGSNSEADEVELNLDEMMSASAGAGDQEN